MIHAIPRSLFSNDYLIYDDSRLIGLIDVSGLREAAGFEVDGVHYQLAREGRFSGEFLLIADGAVLARASKPSALRSTFELQLGGRYFRLQKLSAWRSAFGLFEHGELIGAVQREGWMTRRTRVDLPREWPAAAQIFVFWLGLVIWNREASAAAGG